jgi:choice-of-anchor C domain-containing protein
MRNNDWRRRIATALGAVAAVSGLAVAVAVPAGAAAGLANGGFEQVAIWPNSFQTVPAGETVGRWKVTSGDVDLVHAKFWLPAEGDQSLDLNGLAPGAIAQALNTKPGVRYVVTFGLSGNPDHQGVVTGQLLANGAVINDFSIDGTGTTNQGMSWRTETATFVAVTKSTTLSFRDTSGLFAVGPVIDKIRIKPAH